MSSRRSWAATLLLVMVICALVFRQGGVEAARALAEDAIAGGDDDHLEVYSSVYEKAKLAVGCWVGRLTSGPSPSGPGH